MPRLSMMASGIIFGKAVDLAQAQPQAKRAISSALQGVVPVAERGVGRQHRHAMFARIAHNLGRRIKSHRLGIEQRRGESRGMIS